MKLKKLELFGLQIEEYDIYNPWLDLESLIWKNGFVVLKKLDTHWSQ